MKKIFKATNGAPFSQEEAKIYGKELDKIAEEEGGQLKPENVVEKAKNRNNPLHSYFDWNDSRAGEKYRLFQARNLINHITVVIKYDHKQREQKAFFSVNSTPAEKRKNRIYVTMERVLSEPELREQILVEAIEEIEYWEERYRIYKELTSIFTAIRKAKKRIIKKRKK